MEKDFSLGDQISEKNESWSLEFSSFDGFGRFGGDEFESESEGGEDKGGDVENTGVNGGGEEAWDWNWWELGAKDLFLSILEDDFKEFLSSCFFCKLPSSSK